MDYALANIFGTVYTQGTLAFTPDGKSVVSPVGNRVSVFDVVNAKSFTFAYEHRKNVAHVAINSSSTLLLSIDDDGRGILANFRLRTVLHHFNFKDEVTAVKFSPDGRHIAVALGRRGHVQIWRTPTTKDERQFAPFVRHRVYTGHYAKVQSIEWSRDARFLVTASQDMTARIWSLHSEDKDAAATLAGHRDAVLGAWFSDDQEGLYTVSRDGAQFEWRWSDEDDTWTVNSRNYFGLGRVTCAAFHAPSSLLVVGLATGVFALYELPAAQQPIQTLSISQREVDFVTINSTGEWLLFGAAQLGQLLVWEWQSESYILKQQSHHDALNCVVYSPDGSKIVTGGDDGKIKVWDASSGYNVVTFTQHMAAVTALKFSSRGNVLFSASLDGSVRAWDLLRYRNFRTLTAPKRLQFTSIAVDPSGELVCAGSLNDFDIHVWNLQTSQLVDRLSGHEGPVAALDFAADGATLASASWDHTIRLWNFYGRTAISEPITMQSEVLAIAFRPDGKHLAAASMDGVLGVWDVAGSGEQITEIDVRSDIGSGGRHANDRFSAATSNRARHITNLCWSADGRTLLGGGNSRYLCLYDVANAVLLRKISVSQNMAIDGTLDKLNSRNLTEAGPLTVLDNADANEQTLPGAQRGATSIRSVRPEIRTAGVQFSPATRAFAAASTEGLLVYSAEPVTGRAKFDPTDLDIDITVSSTLAALNAERYDEALIMAFRLGDTLLLERVFLSTPPTAISLVVQGLPEAYVAHILLFIAREGETTPHIEFILDWLRSVLEYHGSYIARERHNLSLPMRAAQKLLLNSKTIVAAAQTNVYQAKALTAPSFAPSGDS